MADGVPFNRYDLAINNPQRNAELPPPPGLASTPKPGEVYVSPELAKHWSADLSQRYKVDKPTGTISEAGLSSPDERVVIRGVDKNSPGVAPADHPKYLETWRGGSLDERMGMLLVLVAFGITLVLFPLLSLVGQAAGVAAKRREHRLAALRLAGATRSQVLWLSAVEQAVLGFLGAIAGLIGYTLLSPLIARIPLGGGRWYVHDLTVSWWVALIVLVAVPVLSVLSALIGLGRVSITPLGVVRGQTRKATSALRLGLLVIGPIMLAILGMGGAVIPLLIGIGMAALAVRSGRPVGGPGDRQDHGPYCERPGDPACRKAARRRPQGRVPPGCSAGAEWVRHRLPRPVHALRHVPGR